MGRGEGKERTETGVYGLLKMVEGKVVIFG